MANTNSTRTKATVTKVYLGLLQIDGLLLPDNQYAVSVSQTAELFGIAINQAARDFKALLGASSGIDKIATELGNQRFNILTLSQFETVMLELALKGNSKAISLMRALAGVALEKIFADAFGFRYEAEDIQKSMIVRMERLTARRGWTDVIKYHLLNQGLYEPSSPYTAERFRSLTTYVNQRLFNQPHFNCKRDNMTHEQQQTITQFETFLGIRAARYPNEAPEQLIKTVLSIF